MERYLLTILLTVLFVAYADGHCCRHENIQSEKAAEIDCDLPPSCTTGEWTKTGLSAKSKTLSAKNCSRCEGKFNVTDYIDSKGKYKSSLKFLNATWRVQGTYTCSCENSPQNSDDTNDVSSCHTISVYVDCHINIAIDNSEVVIQGNSLTETRLHTLVVKAGAKVNFTCSNDAKMRTSENCTDFENSTEVTMNKSYHHCEVACVRKVNPGSKKSDACRMKVLLYVGDSKSNGEGGNSKGERSNDTRGLYWSILIIVIVLSIFCGVFLYGVYFRNKLAQKVNARKQVSSHNGELLYATVAPASQRRDARSVQTLTSTNSTTVNLPGQIEEETNIGIIDPYLVSGADSCFYNLEGLRPGGDFVDTRQFGRSIKSIPRGSKESLQGYAPMTSPNATMKRPKPDEIDLYFCDEYSSIPNL